MKKLLLSFIVTLAIALGALAQDIPAKPNPPRLVNDFANALSADQRAALERKLVAYDDSTSSQIALVIVPSVQPYDISEYAFKLGREWGVGKQGKNNGVVVLWAPQDRKVFIATGYGLEGAIPDAIAKRIVSDVILPQFRNGQYYQGLDQGIDNIIRYASGEYKANPSDRNSEEAPSGFLIFIVVFIVILIIISRSKGGRGGGGRGYRSGGGGGPIFFPYTTYSGGGSHSGNWGGGSGGGFGGFGGGSFGGGGAGGDY
ncbi:YgcG family protein [Telluribacter sp. SYSU D00476]|uniref:TPM domain-containing protein n=1 Tax=Telluribacter sp. SYSU D00476 TaxID=2811430 RepID=UPI001FF65423|nr:TPM domain-containing protein [Telluribacter sp. SYSU D00476]